MMKISIEYDPATFLEILNAMSDDELADSLPKIIRQLTQIHERQKVADIARIQNTKAFIKRIVDGRSLPSDAIENARLALDTIEKAYFLLRRENH
jgi:hypothetical protein